MSCGPKKCIGGAPSIYDTQIPAAVRKPTSRVNFVSPLGYHRNHAIRVLKRKKERLGRGMDGNE
jgi:hypothetical protein